jgi:hypothetical protein
MTEKAQRSRSFIALGLCAFLFPMVGCQQEPAASSFPAFDGQKAFAEVEALVQFSPRDAG